MKLFSLLLILVSCASTSFSQVNLSSETRHYLDEVNLHSKNNESAEWMALKKKLPIREMFGEEVLACVGILNNGVEAEGFFIGSEVNNLASIYIPIHRISEIYTNPAIEYLQIASKIQMHIDDAVKDIRADSVHQGIGLLSSYTGKDVMIGITDWGFDYTHPSFYDTTYTQTRIHAVWDHYRTTGNAPANYPYGVEYTNPTDILAAESDTSNVYGRHYHGTHVAGIAGGAGADSEYRGVAFESDLLFVTFYHDEASVMDAFAWMKEKADAEGKRLVVNMSWGLYHLGNLDGTSIMGQILDTYTAQNIVFVTSGGNNGNVNFHIGHDFTNDTIKSRVNFYNYALNPNMYGQSLTMWGEPGESFETRFELIAGGGVANMTPWYNTDDLDYYVDSFIVFNTDTVFYNLSMDSANYLNARPHARLRIKNTHSNIAVNMLSRANSGTVHYWNVTELTNDLGNWGMPFASGGSGYVAGDNQYGVGEPACNEGTIGVGSYLALYPVGTQGNFAGGQHSSFSSYGPTLDGRVKPEIAAPGSGVASAINSFTDASPSTVGSTSFNGNTYTFGSLSGTSMAGPVVAGVAALILEANPNIPASEVKELLKLTARLDQHTGAITSSGDVQWGWGKVNAYDAVLATTGISSVADNGEINNYIIYPNPTSGELFLKSSNTNELVTVVSLLGQSVAQFYTNTWSNVDGLPNGVYLIKNATTGSFIGKFVKN